MRIKLGFEIQLQIILHFCLLLQMRPSKGLRVERCLKISLGKSVLNFPIFSCYSISVYQIRNKKSGVKSLTLFFSPSGFYLCFALTLYLKF